MKKVFVVFLVASFLAPLAGNVYAQSSEELEDLTDPECIESGYMPNAGWMTTTDILDEGGVVLGYCESLLQGAGVSWIQAYGQSLLQRWLWVKHPITMIIYYAYVNHHEEVIFILTKIEDVPTVRWGVTCSGRVVAPCGHSFSPSSVDPYSYE